MSARVLLVEDEPGIQLAIRGLLRREGHETAVAGSGTEAMQLLADQTFDLVLTDLSLPDGVSGLDLVRHVGENCAGTPVVLITAYGSENIAKDAVEASPATTSATLGAGRTCITNTTARQPTLAPNRSAQ